MKLRGLDCQNVEGHIVNWLNTYAVQAGSQGFVIGISGGVDSALTSSLCARTGLRVICVQMPIHQAPDQLRRASEHIEKIKEELSAGGGPNIRSKPGIRSIFPYAEQRAKFRSGIGFGQCAGAIANEYALSHRTNARAAGRRNRQ